MHMHGCLSAVTLRSRKKGGTPFQPIPLSAAAGQTEAIWAGKGSSYSHLVALQFGASLAVLLMEERPAKLQALHPGPGLH